MQVTVLGITGAVGNAVAAAFLDAGHTVVALARDPARVSARPGLTVVQGDARHADDLDRALRGSDAVLHGLNLPYPDWDPGMMELTEAVIAAARRAGATVLLPGNVYGLGPDFSEPLSEEASHEPVSRKGALRNRLEGQLRQATEAGLQVVVLRAGDFFGGVGEAWMHHLTAKALAGGTIQYPGPREVLHTWAYLPDLAATFVALAERRAELPAWSVFHFEGHVVDGDTWIEAVRTALGDPDRRVSGFPWLWMQPLRLVVPMVRELFEMRYLWNEPVRMDGGKLRALLGEVPHTPLQEAVTATLSTRGRAAA
jgi:nucleoside-diphosphate-sugar epimerase